MSSKKKLIATALSFSGIVIAISPGHERKYLSIATPHQDTGKNANLYVYSPLGSKEVTDKYTTRDPEYTAEEITRIKTIYTKTATSGKKDSSPTTPSSTHNATTQTLRMGLTRKSNTLSATWISHSPISLIIVATNEKNSNSKSPRAQVLEDYALMEGSTLNAPSRVFSVDLTSPIKRLAQKDIESLASNLLNKKALNIYSRIVDSQLLIATFSFPTIPYNGRIILLALSFAFLNYTNTSGNRKSETIAALTLPPATSFLLPPVISFATNILISSLFWLMNNNKREKASTASINLALPAVFLSIGIIGISIAANTQLSNKPVFSTAEDSNYQKGNARWISNPLDPLGYRYPPNIVVKSKKLAYMHDTARRAIVYDVTYTINKDSHRKTPQHNIPSNAKSTAFLGDSFTFGEGLQDNETLPYFYGKYSNKKSINFGMHGYSTHQALSTVQGIHENSNNQFNKFSHYYYRWIPDHIARSSGFADWDLESRRYIASPDKTSIASVTTSELLREVYGSTSATPFIYNILQGAAILGLSYSDPILSIAERSYNQDLPETWIKMNAAIIGEMNRIILAGDSKLTVIVDDGFQTNCKGKASNYSKKLSQELTNAGVHHVLTADIYKFSNCKDKDLIIALDGHPSALSNQLIARYLNKLESPQ